MHCDRGRIIREAEQTQFGLPALADGLQVGLHSRAQVCAGELKSELHRVVAVDQPDLQLSRYQALVVRQTRVVPLLYGLDVLCVRRVCA